MNLLGDFAGGGMLAVVGILIALQERLKSGLLLYRFPRWQGEGSLFLQLMFFVL